MGKNGAKRFKDDIRKTFIIYALVPVIIITSFSYLISFFMWYRTVIKQNYTINTIVSNKLEDIVSSYMNKVNEASNHQKIIDYIESPVDSSSIYEDLYRFVNSMDIKCSFFIFDKNMRPMIESSTFLPAYAKKEQSILWGITRKMYNNRNQVVLHLGSSGQYTTNILTIGKAILKSEEIIGYITFDLDEKSLVSIISSDFSTNIIVTDEYGSVISGTNGLLVNKFGKIDDTLRNKSGFTKTSNNSYYITQSGILGQSLYIYTISSIGYFSSLFVLVGILLIILFLMMTFTTYISARKIANSKTKVIDDIIKAIENVQNGNLDTHLNINSRDEFQIIAESYNQMLADLKNMIELGKEKARQSVLSEIKQLESQFNPHFLFNTLEMIKYMAKTDPASVNKIIVSLSTLLRYSINNTISKVTLLEDLEYTKSYLLIQKYRFNNRFDYTIKVEDGTENCIVPKLIIQPIIENAIKYGFGTNKCLTIKIKANFVEDNLVVVIYDDGIGMEPENLEEIRQILYKNKNSSSHIGLFNVHRRIQLMFGEAYGIEILSEKHNGTVVKIILPINRSDDYDKNSGSGR